MNRRIEEILMHVRGEFNEMPGLTLNVAQAHRSWGLEPHICVAILEALEDARFLRRNRHGAFTRYLSDTPAR
jgi:hypothetical protein